MSAHIQSIFLFKNRCSGAQSAIRWALALCGAILVSCSTEEGAVSSQVAARVNGSEITIHQLNNQLARSGLSSEGETKDVAKKILDSLIDEELLVQQAVERKLDRDPIVMQKIEEAKRRVLSQAYVERLVYSFSAPTAQEVKSYYVEHPELFAKRKIYKWHAFLISQDRFNPALKTSLDKIRTATDIASILKSQSIDFREETLQWPAEQMPMELLRTASQIGIGDIVPFGREKQMALMQLESAAEQPVDEIQAQAAIQKYLINSRNQDLLQNTLKQLRTAAQITYMDQFAERLTGSGDQMPAKKEDITASKQQTDEYLHKGLSGLKK